MARLDLEDAVLDIPLRGWRGARSANPLQALRRRQENIRAVDQVSLSLTEGVRIGLMGRNGAGKSSLLKVAAGVWPLTSGSRRVEGRVRFIGSLADGVRPFLTGRKNARLFSHYLGLASQSADFVRTVEEFAELGPFFDRPMASYSSGMRSRLQFGLATTGPADILLLDEWIGVADEQFRQKAAERLEELAFSTSAVLVATHNRRILRQFTDIVYVLEQGRIKDRIASNQI